MSGCREHFKPSRDCVACRNEFDLERPQSELASSTGCAPDITWCPICGATNNAERWNDYLIWCRWCDSRIKDKYWIALQAKAHNK